MSIPPHPLSSKPTSPASPVRRLLEPGEVVQGRFHVERLAGLGGMGDVYRAWDGVLERTVALKAVRPRRDEGASYLERFRREALALAQLSHPAVCQVYDLVQAPEGTFIAMEWLEGKTLEQVADTLDRRTRLDVLRQAAEGLAAAHAKGLIHRDLKPANLMVTADGLKIMDFGLARLDSDPDAEASLSKLEPLAGGSLAGYRMPLDEGALPTGLYAAMGSGSRGGEKLTHQGFFLGSPRYASPEQIRGELAGTPSDVFSLGVLAWELLSGEHPFPGEGPERMEAILAGRHHPFRGHLSRSLQGLLGRMLAPEPAQRPSASDVADCLRQTQRPVSRLAWAGLSALATLLCLLGAYVLAGRGVIADLARHRPARVAVLPTANWTGDPELAAELRWVVPELLHTSLRGGARLDPIPQEATNGALGRIPEAAAGPSTGAAARRLADTLGAELLLESALAHDAAGWHLSFRLVDASGRVRSQGRIDRPARTPSLLQELPRLAADQLLKAVDPFGRRPRTSEPPLPPEALAAFARGKAAMDRGDFRAAHPHLRKAADSAPGFATAAVHLGICLRRLGDPGTAAAIQWGRWAAHAQGNRRAEMQALTELGLLAVDQGRWEDAQAAFQEAMALAKSAGDADFESALLNNLGNLAMDRQRLPEAQRALEEALRIEQSLHKRGDEMLTLNNLAVLAKQQGDVARAEACYRQVLEASRRLGERWSESLALNNLGDVAMAAGRFAEAERLLLESLALKQAIGHRAGTIIPRANLGILARIRQDYPASERHLAEALSLARELQRQPLEAVILAQLGECHLAAGDAKRARKAFQASAALARRLGDAPGLAQALAGEASAMVAAGLRGGPVPGLLKEALQAAPESPFPHRAEAELLAAEGRRREADAALERAISRARKGMPEEVPGLTARRKRLNAPDERT